jgi:mannan endo-1,4-beta-mannosidase
VNVSWHAPNPFDPALTGAAVQVGAWDFKANTIKKLLKPGDAAYERWQESLKFAADGLTELRDAGVVVIWRPFHEMNGAWFWWGWQAKADFVALWRDMHQYFTQERGLNNLIWAYSPNAAWDKWATPPNFYYPGGDVVDLVGMDFYGPRMMDAAELNIAYTNPDTGKSHIGSYDQLVALGKPMGLFEFGPSPADTSGWDDPKYDFAKLARDIRAKYPKIVMFQAWEWIWRIGAHENASGLMNDPWVISLDEVPAFGR